MNRALVLAHDAVPGRGADGAGTVGTALRGLGFAADLSALAAAVARREAESVAACHRLVGLFCRRALDTPPAQRSAGRGPV